ncbi:unnamed protein product [Paramecium sonneborni]|uniref:Uncharacterized protein n=1 Tax=Paramecium sonneborni TaxID=65129 RepID=A0A8S1RPE3_9CILI|nr:unnamed protein product [Paramecium sonneborni]
MNHAKKVLVHQIAQHKIISNHKSKFVQYLNVKKRKQRIERKMQQGLSAYSIFQEKFVSFNQYRELSNISKAINEQLWQKLRKCATLIQFKEDYTIDKVYWEKQLCKRVLDYKQINKEIVWHKKYLKIKNSETGRIALVKEMTIMRKINHKDLILIHDYEESSSGFKHNSQINLQKKVEDYKFISWFLIQSRDKMKSQQIMINKFQQYNFKRES